MKTTKADKIVFIRFYEKSPVNLYNMVNNILYHI